MVRMMKIIICTKRTINELLSKPKNLLPLKCRMRFEKENPDMQFATKVVNLARSLDDWALLHKNSFLSNP